MPTILESIQRREQLTPLALGLLGVFLSLWGLDTYLRYDFGFILAILMAPFILQFRYRQIYSYRFAAMSGFCLFAYVLLGAKTCLFFGMGFYFLSLLELYIGRLRNGAVFWLFLLSPFADYLFTVFGFPIRLELTRWVVVTLNQLGMQAEALGNIIVLQGEEFEVDDACMGLKTVAYSYLTLLVLLRHRERQIGLEINNYLVLGLLGLTTLLILCSNLSRIVMIVLLRAEPETFLHEILGIICLLLYIVLPLYWIIGSLFLHFGNPIEAKKRTGFKKHRLLVSAGLLALVGWGIISTDNRLDLGEDKLLEAIEINGFEKTKTKKGVWKFINEQTLIYIKPPSPFYKSNHSPIMCWQGSGFSFKRERLEILENRKIYMAELRKEGETLHTAWWYACGDQTTTSQFYWRGQNALNGRAYRLVNLTCSDLETLKAETVKLIKNNPLKSTEN